MRSRVASQTIVDSRSALYLEHRRASLFHRKSTGISTAKTVGIFAVMLHRMSPERQRNSLYISVRLSFFLHQPALVFTKSTGWRLAGRVLDLGVRARRARVRMAGLCRVKGTELRAAVGAVVLLMCWTAITCTRQTPGNPSPNATQSNQSAENTPPRSAPAPTVAEERRPATTAAPPQATPSLAPPVAEVPPTPRPTPPPLVLPAGTLLTVTTSTAISAKSADAGQTFQGALAQPVIYHGRTAIPAG